MRKAWRVPAVLAVFLAATGGSAHADDAVKRIEKQCPGTAAVCKKEKCRWENSIESKSDADDTRICWRKSIVTTERTPTCGATRGMHRAKDFGFVVIYNEGRCTAELSDLSGLSTDKPDGPCGIKLTEGDPIAGDGCISIARKQQRNKKDVRVKGVEFRESLKLTCSCDSNTLTTYWCFGLDETQQRTGPEERAQATSGWGYETSDAGECRRPRPNE